MNDLTKAQLTIGILAIFATIWQPLRILVQQPIEPLTIGYIIGFIFLLFVLAYVILALLEWVKVFDLKTNAIVTLLVLVTIPLLSSVSI
jgi:hypothetical protein